jgi:hypothetical protein
MSKHTPGPWKIFGARAENGTSQEIHAESKFIARVFMNGNPMEREANARLIAAAPDLLAALQKYSLPIDVNNIALSCIEFGSEAVERELQRRAAIAKAEGGTK